MISGRVPTTIMSFNLPLSLNLISELSNFGCFSIKHELYFFRTRIEQIILIYTSQFLGEFKTYILFFTNTDFSDKTD